MTVLSHAKAPPRRQRGRFLTAVGLVLILAGLSFLGYFGWQYYGTNIVSKQKHESIKTSLSDDWGKGIDGDAIGLLRIKRFGDNFEVPIVPGFDDGALARGVGWNTDGAKVGKLGNFALAGHRVTHGEPFRDFLNLRKGDKVVVETRKFIYTYVLRNDGDAITVDFTTSWPLNPTPTPDGAGVAPTKHAITLLTCSELFHTRNRNIVVGDLVSKVNKGDIVALPSG